MTRLVGALAASLLATTAFAQVPVQTVAQTGIPAGNTLGPQNPAGFFSIGNDIWFGDRTWGFRHYLQINSNPIQYQFDTGGIVNENGTNWSIGGNSACVPFCSVGQQSVRSPSDFVLASYDRPKGQPGQVGGGGVYHVTLSTGVTLAPGTTPIGEIVPMAPTKGLAGNLPTAVAWNQQDSKVYVGFLKTPSYVRVTGIDLDNSLQTVESVGTALNGKPVLSLATFANPTTLNTDLYLGTGDGFYVVPNVASCNGNANNCGTPKLIDSNGGPVVAVANDNKGHIYYALANGGLLRRYTPLTGGIAQVSSGFIFAGASTNGLGFDSGGNLFVGDSPLPDDILNSGRISLILASDLAALP